MNKNIFALKFVCNDLNLFPEPCLHSTRLFKKDWVSELMRWVSLIPVVRNSILIKSSGSPGPYVLMPHLP